jgi:hypothetical protein
MTAKRRPLDAVDRMAFSFDFGDHSGVALDESTSVPSEFTAHLQIRNLGAVEMDVVAEPGRVRAVAVRITEPAPGAGLSNLTLARIPVQRLLESATSGMAWIYAPNARRSGSTDQRAAARTAIRRRMSDERLDRVAEVLKAGGGVHEVMAAEQAAGSHIGERQAWRLIKRAREAQS